MLSSKGNEKGFFFLAVHSFVFSKISFLKPKKIASQKKEPLQI